MSIKHTLSDITQDYVRTGRSASFSFDVPSIGTIVCTQVYRAIKGKRIVCLGHVDGDDKDVVKLYFDPRRARIHWQRSDKGCRIFLERVLTAPEILFSGYLVEYKLYAMVLEYIGNALRFDKALADAHSEHHRQQLLNRLIVCLAEHHQAGIIQDDLHMGNFLLRGESIYSLDGDQVRSYAQPIGKKLSMEKVAEFFSNFSPIHDNEIGVYYQLYCSERGYDMTEKDTLKLLRMVKRMRKRHLVKYMRKIFRSRDPFLVHKTHDYFSVRDLWAWDDQFSTVCNYPEDFISESNIQQIEKDCSKHVSTDAGPLILYCSRILGKPLMSRRGIIDRRWRNALRLNRLGIHTLRPIALIKKRGMGREWRAYLIVASCEGTMARDFFASDTVSEDDKDSVVEQIAKAFFAMKQTGISIRGIHSTNILISDLKPIFLYVAQLNQMLFARRSSAANGIWEFLQEWDNDSGIRRLFFERFRQWQLL
jgi:tRNA A-37 threonylcarbamoyl transferase component Bud32